MKLKFLFFSMLSAALFVGCNNESVVNPDVIVDPNSEEVVEGVSTHATFELKFASPSTYAGISDELDQNAGESNVYDATLVIYKLDGTPEAIGYMNATDFAGNPSGAAAAGQKITLRCYSGTKLIYLAVNTGVKTLIQSGTSVTSASNTSTPGWLGDDWTANVANAVTFPALNAPLWSLAGAPGVTVTGPYASSPASATGLIYALTNSSNLTGTPSVTAVGSAGAGFLMTNWGDKDYQNADVATGGTTYQATVKFTLKPAVTANDSRNATPDYTNGNGKNALQINIQRALAKVQVNEIATSVLTTAGTPAILGDTVYKNSGSFAPDANWAFGNLNISEYPFQQWDGVKLKSTLYDSLGAIVDSTLITGQVPPYSVANDKWEKVIDNTRWIGTSKKYSQQGLTVADVRTAIGGAPNVPFATTTPSTSRVYVTENNNTNTLNAYSSFVVFAGKYTPTQYIDSVNSAKGIHWAAGNPTYTSTPTDKDTLYYIQNTDTTGVFIWGKRALRQFVGWYILGTIATYNPGDNPSSAPEIAAATAIQDYIDNLKTVAGNVPAKLQSYYQGYCFYRVFIRDRAESQGPNIASVRRNHIYNVSITKIKGPGISDPNDIIDPHPEEPEPLEEAETWVTASVQVMKWHVIAQADEVGLN